MGLKDGNNVFVCIRFGNDVLATVILSSNFGSEYDSLNSRQSETYVG